MVLAILIKGDLMGALGILDFASGILRFFKMWVFKLSVAVVIINVVLFVNSAIRDIYAQVQIYSWEHVSGGGSLLNSVLTIIGMLVPANITAVLTLVVSIHALKIGIIVFLFAKRLYWDMLSSLMTTK